MWKEIGKACGLTPSVRKTVLTLRDTKAGCTVTEERKWREKTLNVFFPLSLRMPPPPFLYLFGSSEKEDPNNDDRAPRSFAGDGIGENPCKTVDDTHTHVMLAKPSNTKPKASEEQCG